MDICTIYIPHKQLHCSCAIYFIQSRMRNISKNRKKKNVQTKLKRCNVQTVSATLLRR